MPELPARPSKENLRKQAKRLARDTSLGLAEAQRRLAGDYGSPSWADLMRRVEAARGEERMALSPLGEAARAGDLAAVRRFLAEGHAPDDATRGTGTPLWQACAGDAPADIRAPIAEALLGAGANPRHDGGGETALHAAASHGPLALVELLIAKGALEWQTDRRGRAAVDVARRGSAPDKAAIVELLDRPVIRDPAFKAAVAALQRGDAAGLGRLLDTESRLLRERIVEPQCYREAERPQYFRDPRLFWFIANNPTLMKRMPANMVEVADVMIARGADQSDLDYALELVMTSSPAREQGLQMPLLRRLVAAGAKATPQAIDMTLAHRELAPVEALLRAGHPLTAPIAAAFGRTDRLKDLLRHASDREIHSALSLAAVNGQTEAARLAIDAGADVNAFMAVHAHSTPLHQASLDENLDLMELLLARGARTDIADTLWGSTPLGWAIHQGKARSRAYLESPR
jgi:ankyrin repeat protein